MPQERVRSPFNAFFRVEPMQVASKHKNASEARLTRFGRNQDKPVFLKVF